MSTMADYNSAFSAADAQVVAAVLSVTERAIEARTEADKALGRIDHQEPYDAVLQIGVSVMVEAAKRITQGANA